MQNEKKKNFYVSNAIFEIEMKKQEREKYVQKGWPDAENVTVERETDLELGLVIAG